MNEDIKIVDAYEYKEELKKLFVEYTDSVIEKKPEFKGYLAQQNFDEEVEHLNDKYGKPYGRVYICFCEGKAAGCIALKRIDNKKCEMKRLYVRSDFRGKHIGSLLVNKVIEDAKSIGYAFMLLDTFDFLTSAINIYKRNGFYEIDKYNDSPIDDAIYMRLDLK